jgi:tRNA-splicing ligase RtcB (3'-phosphate/5'-hydroxy nucleic acid ligase)
VRLLAAEIDREQLTPRLTALMNQLDTAVPRGLRRGSLWQLTGRAELEQLLLGGAGYAVERGHGVYDVSHNLAKIEPHHVGGRPLLLCVHRKGATRALPPGHPDLPADLTAVGQPVLIPGTMGTASHVLTGMPGGPAWYSTCHGAGRLQSRHQAARVVSGRRLRDELQLRGIVVRGASWRGLAEEAPTAYKDVDAVVEASEGADLARRVARLIPLGVLKG